MAADSFDGFKERLRAGDQEATALVFNRFACRILALARRRLNAVLRAKVDPEDVLQSVFRSFFTRQRDGRLDIADWDSLWGILLVLTVRKCGRRAQYHQARRRDARREASWTPALESEGHAALFAQEPTPSEAAMLNELVARLMRGLPEADRAVLTLHLQGHTVGEIKERTGRAMRTIRRILERVREQLRASGAAEPSPAPELLT